MITSKVTQMMAMLGSPELMGNVVRQPQEAGMAFGALLNQTAGNGTQDIFSAESFGKSVRNDDVSQTAFERESAKSGCRGNQVTGSSPADDQSGLPQDAAEKLNDFGKQAKEVIAEKLGISEEEVTQQMEAMGFLVTDLMDPSKLASLVLELTGSEDLGGLLLDGDFQQMLGQISELSQELAVQLNLTAEEMNQLAGELRLMISEQPQQEVSKDTVQPVQNADASAPDVAEVPASQAHDTVLQDTDQAAKENPQPSADRAEVQDNVVQTAGRQGENESAVTVQVQEGTEEEAGSSEEQGSGTQGESSDPFSEAEGKDKAENRQIHVTYQTTARAVGQGQVAEVTQTVVQARVDAEDILRQVTQLTRVFVNQAESSVEMQLNPANLGKIYLQVVSREGVITAQIAAQNEAVKEALESQVAVLKENMNQQGMKVEAIEVTIASHEFERNLEENQQNAARERQEEEASKTGRRNLNLNSPDEMEGLVSEEESLAAKIMAEQGNSMDVTA